MESLPSKRRETVVVVGVIVKVVVQQWYENTCHCYVSLLCTYYLLAGTNTITTTTSTTTTTTTSSSSTGTGSTIDTPADLYYLYECC